MSYWFREARRNILAGMEELGADKCSFCRKHIIEYADLLLAVAEFAEDARKEPVLLEKLRGIAVAMDELKVIWLLIPLARVLWFFTRLFKKLRGG